VRAGTLLRGAAGVAFVQFVGHATLFVRARPTHGASEEAVVTAMRAHAFRFASSPRTYWDMYFGYGLEAAFVCLVEAVLFWQLARIADRDAALVRPLVALFLVANLAHIAMLAVYFAFPVPMAFDTLLAAVLLLALYSATPLSFRIRHTFSGVTGMSMW